MFKNNSITVRVITKEELEKINNFMNAREWFDLANSVDKLAKGTEKEGLGKFLYNYLAWDASGAQLAGHIGVIFTLSDIWEFNNQKRGMKFRKKSANWEKQLKTYYEEKVITDV